MPASVSAFDSVAMNPTAAREEWTAQVSILQGKVGVRREERDGEERSDWGRMSVYCASCSDFDVEEGGSRNIMRMS